MRVQGVHLDEDETGIDMSRLKITQICCPACHGSLDEDSGGVTCVSCNTHYPCLLNIMDLRHPRPITAPKDRKRIDTLVEAFDTCTFEELLGFFLEGAKLSPKITRDTLDYYAQLTGRSQKMTGMFLKRYEESFGSLDTECAVDIGCGAGGGALALAKYFNTVLAVDSDLAQLILARKLISQTTVTNIRLICAYAQHLPGKTNSFSYAQGINVIEHLEDVINPFLGEIHRCLIKGGGFAADSRNRFDIFTPEPHSGIRLLGYLPRRWIPVVARRLSGNHYENTRLHSLGELKSVFRASFFDYRIVLPYISAYGLSQKLDRWIRLVEKLRFINQVVMPLFPAHLILAKNNKILE
jgi:ubiquinone/menaquinone biosynthesis C-methylase UbiE